MTTNGAGAPAETAAGIARHCRARLVSYLAVRSRDVAAAEDALADAIVAALETWPRDGVPRQPEAWLLTAARRRLLDRARHAGVHRAAATAIALAMEEAASAEPHALPDHRLRLLFACAHPAIDPAVRTPLMLQAVLGLDAARVAAAFAVPPATMGQRLVRAKAKLRDAGIAFEVPEGAEWPARLEFVLDAIYAAYGVGWDDVPGAAVRQAGLVDEALYLGRLVAGLLPAEPEARGLLALMLFCESRRATRRQRGTGAYVPLQEQDPAGWSAPMIAAAERELGAAARAGRFGRYQLEAAIQSVHADRRRTGVTRWDAVALLYTGLLDLAPTLGAAVGRAAALGESGDAEGGLQALSALGTERIASYQPYWAARARCLARCGAVASARKAFDRAADLAGDPAVRAYLVAERDRLGAP